LRSRWKQAVAGLGTRLAEVQAMGKHRARVLHTPDATAAAEEISRLGVKPPALQWMAAKAFVRAVRLEKVRGKAAALLKQECLAVGCDCAVAPEVAAFDDTPRAVILLGTPRQYERLLPRLAGQAFGLGEIGREVAETIERYEAAARPVWRCRGRDVPTDRHTVVMGIINVTDDSFSGDGLAGDVEAAVAQGLRFVEAGAEVLDIGAESTRPGSLPVPVEQELARVVPVVKALAEQVDVTLSVDTQKPQVARAALEAGAHIVNDVAGLRAEGMAETVAEFGAGAVIMHMLGEPRTMQVAPHYDDLMTEIYDFLAERVEAAVEAGISEEAIALDPGFGFGKTVEHNLEMLRRLSELRSLGRPILIGTSRKSTIGKVLGKPEQERLMGTAATCALSVAAGAHLLRVHDVAEIAQVARMTDAILQGWQGDEAS